MVKLEAQEWYYGMLPPDGLETYLNQPGDFLMRSWDAGKGTDFYLSCKCEKAGNTTGTSNTISKEENVTQNDESDKVSFLNFIVSPSFV